jgi:peptidoglycan-associated lipoprotein
MVAFARNPAGNGQAMTNAPGQTGFATLRAKALFASLLVTTSLLVSSCQRSTQRLPPMPPMPQSAGRAVGQAPLPPLIIDDSRSSGQSPGIASERLDDFIQAAGTDQVLFDFDSHDLDKKAKKILDKQLDWLLRRFDAKILIEGYADDNVTRNYSYALGERRANSIRNYFVQSGVDVDRISVISYGRDMPVIDVNNEESRSLNRRGRVVITNK